MSEAQRERQLQLIAFEMVAAHFGQADWQRFRQDKPLEYLHAKVEVVSAPSPFLLKVNRDFLHGTIRFSFRFGGRAAFRRVLPEPLEAFELGDFPRSARASVQFVPEIAPRRFQSSILERILAAGTSETDIALLVMLNEASELITSDTGIETRFSVRSDRAAYAHSQKEKACSSGCLPSPREFA